MKKEKLSRNVQSSQFCRQSTDFMEIFNFLFFRRRFRIFYYGAIFALETAVFKINPKYFKQAVILEDGSSSSPQNLMNFGRLSQHYLSKGFMDYLAIIFLSV